MIDASVDPIGAIKELQGDVSRGKLQLLRDEIETCRQWFDAVQDLNSGYLEAKDYKLAASLYDILGMRVPNSIKANIS